MRIYSTLVAVFCLCSIFAQTDIEKTKETVSKSNIEGHIYFLADDLLKGRATGTPELKIAASYLANAFRRYGVKPNPKTGTYYQEVKLKSVSPPSEVNIQINDTKITDYALINPAQIAVEGDAIFLKYGLSQDYSGKSVSGKVIVVKAGGPDTKDARAAFGLRSEKQKIAKEHGVAAIIELLDTDANMWGFIDHNFNEARLMVAEDEEDNKGKDNSMVHIWVLDTAGTMAKELETSTTLKAKVSLNEEQEEAVLSQNVIGIVEGTDPKLKEEYIIYSAHYDHVGIGTPDETGDTIYNGARDNAIGTTTVLSMAENLAKYPTKRSALFILFTGEEKGLLGSEYYVENPVLPLNQMVYCFNSDNGGYNDTSLATIIGLTRTTAEKNITTAATTFGLKAIEDPAKEQGLFDRSDNVNFAKKGIPAPTFSLGFSSFDGDVTKYYHRPGDEADTLDYDYLFKFFSAYVLAGRQIGNDPTTPTWVAGDKYEAASKALYEKAPEVPMKN
ncbi:M28 family peptidase [Maribacter sp. MJ134]|uniref:M28 family peptidase n=1 Tax=Maribacter sp. MJ134 TaxID=2496865 RepID=UPI000F82F371|nr:M28 family peptidase [Maribacter sp. MJ134]AZQ57789.1 M28 family peptidase [Maribacter sp. MJ134]